MRRGRRRRRRVRRRRILLVGGLVAFGVHKMSKRDAERVEQHTGIPPEEMEDDDLEQTMDELGIEKQKVTADDKEQGGGDPQSEAPASSGMMSELDELEKLAELHNEGILTDEEFAAKKKEILGL